MKDGEVVDDGGGCAWGVAATSTTSDGVEGSGC